MKPHRFDPLSFVGGISFVAFGLILLFGDVGLEDLRPSHLWPLPVLAVGLLLTLYGVRRLLAGWPGAAAEEAPDPGEEGDPPELL
jgi:hypothetical protein